MAEITANRLLSLLAAIEAAVPLLTAQPAVREVGSQVKSSRGRVGSRPPGDLDVLDLTWEASNQAVLPKLLSWAVMIWEERTEAGLDDDGPVDATLTEVCAYLRSRIAFVVTQTWADELDLEWTEMAGQLRHAPGSPLHREILGRTPCTATVYDVAGGRPCVGTIVTRLRDHGRGVTVTSRCADCGTVYDDVALELAQQKQADALAPRTDTAAGCAARLDVGVRQIEYWAARGEITRGPKVDGQRTYLVAQVADRATRDYRRSVHACAQRAAHVGTLGTARTHAP